MGRSAGISERVNGAIAAAALLPFLALAGCANGDQAMADKVAAAEAAASRAEAAQHAAEKAAAAAATGHPAPAPEPTVAADTFDDSDSGSSWEDQLNQSRGNDRSSASGSDQTATPDGTVTPGRG
jgi:hypothetical protein